MRQAVRLKNRHQLRPPWRLALRAPLRLVHNSTESGGLRGVEGGGHTNQQAVVSASHGDVMNFSRNSENRRRQIEENRRKHTERTGNRPLNRPPVQTTLFPRPMRMVVTAVAAGSSPRPSRAVAKWV